MLAHVQAVAQAAKSLRDLRRDYMEKCHQSLRDLYRTLDKPGKNPLRDAHTALDRAVLAAYGWADVQPDDITEILTRLLALNLELAEKEVKKESVQAPGLPASADAGAFVPEDCVEWEG